VSAAVGYSGTPLPKKLGFKPGMRVAFVGLPRELDWLVMMEAFGSVERVETACEVAGQGLDLVHVFHTAAARLKAALPALRAAIQPAGMIWISWPKRASGVPTDITEDVVRAFALDIGLVDVKVCAVTEVWSGLKLVIPVAQRATLRVE
jgi:hypothetical protein